MAGVTLAQLSINISGSGDNTILTPATNQAIHIHYLELQNTSGTQTTVIFKDGTTAFNGAGWLMSGGTDYTFSPGRQEESNTARKIEMHCGVGNAFKINLSGANQHSGFMLYSLESS